jgi:hypothetical protein
MRLFKKRLTPEELGGMIYEHLRTRLASSGPLSIAELLERLRRVEATLPEQHQGAIMVGVMFGAILAIERSTTRWIARRIIDGMHREFGEHLREQGASLQQTVEWQQMAVEQERLYRHLLEGYDEALEPPWKLGRQLLWNMTGAHEYVAVEIKEATLFLLEARDVAQSLLNQYGPTLITEDTP